MDREEDKKGDVGSTAVFFGDYVLHFVRLCAVVFVALLAYVGHLNHQGAIYFAISVGGTALWLLRQFWLLDINVPASCWGKFLLPNPFLAPLY